MNYQNLRLLHVEVMLAKSLNNSLNSESTKKPLIRVARR